MSICNFYMMWTSFIAAGSILIAVILGYKAGAIRKELEYERAIMQLFGLTELETIERWIAEHAKRHAKK